MALVDELPSPKLQFHVVWKPVPDVSAESGPGAVVIEPRALGEAGFGHADLAKLLGSLLASP